MTIEAEPEPITVGVADTAVVVVDMQNDFCSRGGLFDCAGGDISTVQKAIEPTRRVIGAAREAEIKIAYLKMGFRPDLSDIGESGSPNRERHLRFGVGRMCTTPDGTQGRFLIRDTWNTNVIDELQAQSGDAVLYKHRFSGFYETELGNILRGLGIRNLILTGCTTSVCVDSTIRDAIFRDYRCILLADCTDVYVLGVLLFLILAGQHPAGASTRSAAEIVKAVVETETGRASDVVASSTDIGIIAEMRSISRERLPSQLRGDLDTIISKALKKNPAERYVSVAALAADLQHYLKQEPQLSDRHGAGKQVVQAEAGPVRLSLQILLSEGKAAAHV